MTRFDGHARSTGAPKTSTFQPVGRVPTLFGVFLGYVKDVSDVQKNGRIRVWIPELGSTPENHDSWVICSYCSPFAGATNVETASKTNVESFEGTQTSYGFWMVPPDINNQVLVMFINGDPGRAVWIGSLFNQFVNNMVPGSVGNANNYQYPEKFIPVAEYNKWDKKANDPDDIRRPYNATKFKGLSNQGLITDMGRGVSDSSARRESPSQVFGILTPGPAIDPSVPAKDIRRKGGSALIMDDAEGSESVVLTTKTGAQLRLDETNGYVYMINRDGTAWVEMDQKGNIHIFGASSISMRAQSDFNIRADRNINIEAGQNIFIKAAKDTSTSSTSFTYDVNNKPRPSTVTHYKYVGEGKGEGGNIVVQALNNVHATIQKNMYLTVRDGLLSIEVEKDFHLTTVSGKQEFNSSQNIDMQTGQNYNLKAALAINTESGTSINNTAGSNILNKSAFFDVTASSRFSNQVQMNALLKVTGGALIGGNVKLGGRVPTDKPINPAAAGNADKAIPAEVKQMVEKVNVLATWEDPESKFKRNAESWMTTVSVMPTFEPSPEHEKFSFKSVTGYTPQETEGGRTYEGSGGPGNDIPQSPPTNTDPGANNQDLPPTPASESAVSKDFNMNAYECQLKIHEGIKYVSYFCSAGYATGGIGHLLRDNELTKYPVPTPITADQVNRWFQTDAQISISGAQRLIGMDTWADMTDCRKRACADLYFNLGGPRLSKFKRFIAAMKAKDYNAAGQSLRESKWFGQVGRRGPNIITMIVQSTDPNGCDKRFPPS